MKIKLKAFQIVLVVIFLLFLIFFLTPKNYTKTYNINKVAITENYDKKGKYYYFTFKYKDATLDMLIPSKYYNHRQLIKDLKLVEDNADFCLIPTGKDLNFYPLCYSNNEQISFSLASNKLKKGLDQNLFKTPELLETYNDIDIYNNDFNYYIWNYNGFYYLNKKKNTKIDIFDKELYTINLIGYTQDFLVIADYDSNYTFNKYYTIELQNGKLKKHDLDYDIYFDSYYPGYIKNKLYIVDSKEYTMYEFNAKNGKLDKVKTRLLKGDKWQDKNIKNLISTKEEFTYDENIYYNLKDNKIYLNYQDKKLNTLVTTDVTSIVRIKGEDIFYLKESKLYHFNPTIGEELLLEYFEWNFNYQNMIYID